MKQVPLEERVLVLQTCDELERFSGFSVHRRANEIFILNDDPSKDKYVAFDTPSKAHEIFRKSVHQPVLVEIPAATDKPPNQ